MNYYKNYAAMYKALPEEKRKLSREHWDKVHAENLADGREDLYMFSAQIVAIIRMIDADMIDVIKEA